MNSTVSAGADANPRKQFDTAVDYAIQVSNVTINLLQQRRVAIGGLRYLELGPGADFAPQLVLASMGARVTLVDKFLAPWDPYFHPDFYRAFLSKWPGEKTAVESALLQGGYGNLLQLVQEPIENMPSIPYDCFDFVLSNAVLEHVMDLPRAVAELSRVTRAGGIHAHQVDFRDHRNFERPFEYLLLQPEDFAEVRQQENGTVGTTQRFPEMLEAFTENFWVWETQLPDSGLASWEYAEAIAAKLPVDSPYGYWPIGLLRVASMRLVLVRKRRLNYVQPWRRNLHARISNAFHLGKR